MDEEELAAAYADEFMELMVSNDMGWLDDLEESE